MADIEINPYIERILKERMNAEYQYDDISGFPYVSNVIYNHCSSLYENAVANASDSRPDNERSRYYRKQLSDGTWMRLRVGNHQPNMRQTYNVFLENKFPTTNQYGNICIMFYGKREELGSSWKVKDEIVKVNRSIIDRMHGFQHMTYYYLPGLIKDADAHFFNDAIDEWFDGDGLSPFDNKVPDIRVRYKPNKNSRTLDVLLNACAGYTVATISFEAHTTNEVFIGTSDGLINSNKIKMSDAVIVDDYGNKVGTGAFYYQEKEMYVNLHTKEFTKVLSQEEIDAQEFEKKYKKMDEEYQRILREWMNSQY